MGLYERDYDNFLDKLKAKLKKKKAEGKTAEGQQAQKDLKEAKEHKLTHLKQKAQDLVDKAGGIQGSAATVQNVLKYFKTDSPSDYAINFGKDAAEDKPEEKKIFGMPPMAVYLGGTVVFVIVLYGASQLIKPKPASAPQIKTT